MNAVLKPLPAPMVEVSIGYDHPADDEQITWVPRCVSRDAAARMLREARGQHWPISISTKGFGIYAGPNPTWSYRWGSA